MAYAYSAIVFRQPGLSARAKGVYAYIQTLPGPYFSRRDIYSSFIEGRYALDTALKELIRAGHIKTETNRQKGNRFKYTRYYTPGMVSPADTSRLALEALSVS